MLTRQQLFDNALLGIRKNGRSIGDNGCKYRNGVAKCAIGHSIPDHLLNEIEQKGYNTSHFSTVLYTFDNTEFDNLFDPNDFGFIADLQDAHDYHFQNFERRMKDLALKENLNFAELT